MNLTYLTQPPFDVLSNDERKILEKNSQIIYLDTDECILNDWFDDFFVVIKGELHHHRQGEMIASLHHDDWFTHLNTGDAVCAYEQSLLYRIHGDTLRQIASNNPRLDTALFAELSDRVNISKPDTEAENQRLFHETVMSLGTHIKTPHFVTSTTSLYDAVAVMNAKRAKHVLVTADTDPAHTPPNIKTRSIGMFTQADVCRAVGQRANFDEPIHPYVNFNLTTIHQDQELSEALLIMLNHKIHRLPIIDDLGNIVGVLGQTELLNFLTNHSELIVSKIEQSTSIETLNQVVTLIGKFIITNHKSGSKIHRIARTVQSLNARVFAKLWQLIAPKDVIENTCLIVMGSEGRGEQILRTDQDNALIVKDGYHHPELALYAKTFNDALATLGYPYCDGNIMINNPLWCKSLSEFCHTVDDWYQKSGESMIWLATLLDAHYVCGERALFDALMHHVHTGKAHAAPNYLNRFAKAVVQFGDRGHFWQRLTGQSDHEVDLKKAGIFPIVHGVRVLALEYDVHATNTRARLQQLVKCHAIEPKLAQNLTEALDFFLAKRLDAAITKGSKSAVTNTKTLSSLERDLLKESLAVVKSFKDFIFRHYRLDVFGA